jgi:prepilin-type processing-associated H-X9-DG protein
MKEDRLSVNFGWVARTFDIQGQERGIFTCPDDPDPKPVPALLDQYTWVDNWLLHNTTGRTKFTTSADAVFNRLMRVGSTRWQLYIEDLVEGGQFAFDIGTGEYDLRLSYNAPRGAETTVVRNDGTAAVFDHAVLTHRGRTVWANTKNSSGAEHRFPLLWMSYSANAMAAMKNAKGMPALLVEGTKFGVFPIALGHFAGDKIAAEAPQEYDEDRVRRSGRTVPDPRGTPLRFRHGGLSTDPRLIGADFTKPGSELLGVRPDRRYTPRSRMNVGFVDGHVELLHYSKMLNPRSSLWLGVRHGKAVMMD